VVDLDQICCARFFPPDPARNPAGNALYLPLCVPKSVNARIPRLPPIHAIGTWRLVTTVHIKTLRNSNEPDADESVPDHSTISRTRRLIDVETHQAVFQWVLQVLAEKKLLKGTTIGVDATTLEANAALRSIVRRDTGERYEEFLLRLRRDTSRCLFL
jgi:hypothetical protein